MNPILNIDNSNDQFLHLPNYEKKWIIKFQNFVADNIDKSVLRVSDAADFLGMSERQLYRKMKKSLNQTPNSLIRQIKMEQARNYLERGEFSTVAEVSFAVGFKRPDYFSEVYSAIYGKRPVEYL